MPVFGFQAIAKMKAKKDSKGLAKLVEKPIDNVQRLVTIRRCDMPD